ncbi:ATP-binding cassette transporter abc1 [Verticillium alfalfae VaMs.102]|uniref:ATP-binding cassette transporter abc1 n=1 Tax=Verticillium alfalfae (strain VaMs.102 / ATCC MYA-4576 / FGSC 10136) TaxID=526221 RepID=C9S7R2_VERA1|nr:ATP-binding cassette transporter abc1 [Verticillium alfalfae VaMs.102]EEY14797.1 ATP-binding cassette transporter abc1 [Verticillium alfalfae VaMs.102]
MIPDIVPERSFVLAATGPQSLLSSSSINDGRLPWVTEISLLAEAGHLQILIILVSLLWTSYRLLNRQYTKRIRHQHSASAIRWRWEACALAIRATTFVFLVLAASEGQTNALSAVCAAYALIFALSRLINDMEWRHIALHQTNFVLTTTLILVAASAILPCIEAREPATIAFPLKGAVISLALSVFVSLITPREWVPPSLKHALPKGAVETDPAPEEVCSWADYFLTYDWLTPLIWTGASRPVTIDDLPKLAWYDDPLLLLSKIKAARAKSKNTLWTVLRLLKKEALIMASCIATAYLLELVAPFALYQLLSYLADPKGSVIRPWVWLLLMFCGPLSRSVCFQQYVFTSTRLIVRVKSSMTQELYHRAIASKDVEDDVFAIPSKDKKAKPEAKTAQTSSSTGRLANLMAADVDAVFMSRDIIMIMIGVPTGTCASIIGLYKMLGWPSLVGAAVLLLASPLSIFIAQLMAKTTRIVRRAQDSRISLVSEYLSSIRAVKYFAWEDAAINRILEARENEQQHMWRVSLLYMDNGNKTVVGENGASLSGGQKARVALARALYSKAPLLLLDDIFSALDAKTSALLWERCFCSDMLDGRTTVLVAQQPWVAAQSDLAITLDKGEVVSTEQNLGIVRQPVVASQEVAGGSNPGEPELEAESDALNDRNKTADDPTGKNLVAQEMKASGKSARLMFFKYMTCFGSPFYAVVCLLVMLFMNMAWLGSSLWLSIWVEAYSKQEAVDITFYLGIYAAFTFAETISYALMVLVFENGAWHAAKKLHRDFIRAVMRVSLSWYKDVPVGRIINRFSRDMYSVDSTICSQLRNFLDCGMSILFRLGAISSILPVFMLPAAATCAIGVVVGEMYTRTAVTIKRLVASAQSPVFTQFSDTLAGLAVIRARDGMGDVFSEALAERLRTWSRAAEANYNCNRWVAMRVDVITALVGLTAGIIAVSKAGIVAAGLVGFSLTNATGLSQTILHLVRSMNDLEVEMQSFARVREYAGLEPEEKSDKSYAEEGQFADDDEHVIPRHWPATGKIEFRNLVLSLLRFTHIVSGEILYDGIDITKTPRRRLREALTIIPQEAVLFNGTVESNLDPTGNVEEDTLAKALQSCRDIASFQNQANGALGADGNAPTAGIALSTQVTAKGENFSHGQRQVLSLCRALVRKSRLMLLDEATASMDYETDRGIQEALRRELDEAGGDRTLVTIAHRLRTIIDYDTVVVMAGGRVVEVGRPKELYARAGVFYDMVYHSGEGEELKEMLGGDGESSEVSS